MAGAERPADAGLAVDDALVRAEQVIDVVGEIEADALAGLDRRLALDLDGDRVSAGRLT